MPSRMVYEELQNIAENSECAECGGMLVVAVNPEIYDYRLRCGGCGMLDATPRFHSEPGLLKRITRGQAFSEIDRMMATRYLHKVIGEERSAGKEPNPYHLQLLEDLEGGNTVAEDRGVALTTTTTTTAAGKRDLMTDQEAGRFLDMAKLDLAPELREFAVALMRATGLNPMRNEIIIYEKRPYITIDGWRRILTGSGVFNGQAGRTIWLTKDEKEARGIPVEKIACEVGLYRKGMREPVWGLGIADPKNPYRSNQVERSQPQHMAEKRGWMRAARAGFQDVLDGYGLPAAIFAEEGDDYSDVSRTTGEIIEGTATEVLTQPDPDPDTLPYDQPDSEEEEEEQDEAAPAEEEDEVQGTSDEEILTQDNLALAVVIQERGFNAEGIHKWISDLRNFGDSFEFLPHTKRLEAIERIKQIQRSRNTYGAPQK